MKLIYCTSIAFSNKVANRVQVRAMSKEFQKQIGEGFYLGVNYKNVEDKDINIICFNNNKSYILAWKYLKFIKKNKIENIYCREARLLFFIILYNKAFFHLKLNFIYEIHSLLERNNLDFFIDKFLSKNVKKFIFVTKILQGKYINKYKININRTIVAPDAVDLDIFDINLTKDEARKKLNLPLDKKILGYTGKFMTMGMDKGIIDILKTISIIKDINIIFIAVGGSEKEIKYYKNLSQEFRVEKYVKFYVSTSQENLAIYQKSFDILLMPFPENKHYAYYMSPLKMFEYMASRRPIIASVLPSIGEILNEYNSLLIEPDNPEKLAKAIDFLLSNREIAQRISKQAFKDVKSYTWEKRVEKILLLI